MGLSDLGTGSLLFLQAFDTSTPIPTPEEVAIVMDAHVRECARPRSRICWPPLPLALSPSSSQSNIPCAALQVPGCFGSSFPVSGTCFLQGSSMMGLLSLWSPGRFLMPRGQSELEHYQSLPCQPCILSWSRPHPKSHWSNLHHYNLSTSPNL